MPLLALGIPGSGTTAVMLAAFQMYGLQPGPLLFTQDATLVWALIASLYVSNVLLLVLNLPLVRVWVQLLRVPRPLLFAAVLAFATLGVYSLDGSLVDVGAIYVLGLAACVLRGHGVPPAPIVLAVVLGPLLEQEFRRAMAISGGDPTVFVTRPIAAGLLVLAVAGRGGAEPGPSRAALVGAGCPVDPAACAGEARFWLGGRDEPDPASERLNRVRGGRT